MFAVFEAKGFQYIGSPGEKLRIPRLDSEVGEEITFDKVLLVKNGDTQIGKPYVEGASITAEIVGNERYKKIIVFKFKKRNRYKRTRGHRQAYTEIEIKDIKVEAKEEKTTKSKKAGSKTTEKKKPIKTTAKSKKKSEEPEKKTRKTTKTKKTTTRKKKMTSRSKKASGKAGKAKKTTGNAKKSKKTKSKTEKKKK